jgi:hypothetical protein
MDEQHVNIVFDKDVSDLSQQQSKPVEPIGIKLSQSNESHLKKHHSNQ